MCHPFPTTDSRQRIPPQHGLSGMRGQKDSLREPKMTLAEYNKAQAERQRVIRQNASRRMKHLPALPVPDKPTPPLVPIAYSPSGEYIGRLEEESECPKGAVVKWEKAQW